MSETTKSDAFFQQVPPVRLSSPLLCLYCVCVCVCVRTLSSQWNSRVFASSASPMKFIARAAGLQPHSQKPGQDTNSACSNGTLASVDRLRASVFIGSSSRQFEHNTKHLGITMLVNGMPGIPSGKPCWPTLRVNQSPACLCVLNRRWKRGLHQLSQTSPLPFWGQSQLDLLTGLDLWDSYSQEPIMVWGHTTSHSLTADTHSHTQAERMLHHLTGDRNQTVAQISEHSSVMLRIPQMPKWSGLVPDWRKLPRWPHGWRKCNKTKQMSSYYAHEVTPREKDTGSHLKGMQRKEPSAHQKQPDARTRTRQHQYPT